MLYARVTGNLYYNGLRVV